MAKKAIKQDVETDEIELTGIVTIVGNHHYFKNDKEYNVTAELAKTLIKKGYAKLKA